MLVTRVWLVSAERTVGFGVVILWVRSVGCDVINLHSCAGGGRGGVSPCLLVFIFNENREKELLNSENDVVARYKCGQRNVLSLTSELCQSYRVLLHESKLCLKENTPKLV
jgi:hypothetical protein